MRKKSILKQLFMWGIVFILSYTKAHAAIDCNKPLYSNDKIICSDPSLSKMDNDLQRIVTDKSAVLGPEAAKTLAKHQEWFLNFGENCVNFRWTDLNNPHVAEARQCIAKEYEIRRKFLTALPMDVKPQAPYLLSGFERAMLADTSYTVNGGYSPDSEGDHILQVALKRVINAIPDSAQDDSYFMEAANREDSDSNQIDQGRYLFGWSFERHAGFNSFFTLVDLKTGEVIFARSTPDKITLILKACTSDEFKRYADRKIRETLYHNAKEADKTSNSMLGKAPPNPNDPPSPDPSHIQSEIQSSDCK